MNGLLKRCGDFMTERMRDAYVVHDQNGYTDLLPSQSEAPMSMGDGTFMADNAFRESLPMMSYTPEELGINMAAYPMQTDTALALGSKDLSSSGDMKSMNPQQEAIIQASSNPFLAVVQQDEQDGGVQFSAESSITSWVDKNSTVLLIGILLFGAGWIAKSRS
jgi:hypothetical protein